MRVAGIQNGNSTADCILSWAIAVGENPPWCPAGHKVCRAALSDDPQMGETGVGVVGQTVQDRRGDRQMGDPCGVDQSTHCRPAAGLIRGHHQGGTVAQDIKDVCGKDVKTDGGVVQVARSGTAGKTAVFPGVRGLHLHEAPVGQADTFRHPGRAGGEDKISGVIQMDGPGPFRIGNWSIAELIQLRDDAAVLKIQPHVFCEPRKVTFVRDQHHCRICDLDHLRHARGGGSSGRWPQKRLRSLPLQGSR